MSAEPVDPSRQTTVPIDAIRVGSRYRKDLGDLNSLVASIKHVGLLHPIVITPEYQLIAGQRRLEACKLLARSDVPVHVVDLDRLVAGEYAENTVRKDFAPSEAVAIAEALKPRLAAQATERKRAGKRPAGKLPDGPAGDTRDQVAKHVRMSGRSLEKATAVVAAARQDPEKFSAVAEQMDLTRKVDPAYQEVKKAAKASTSQRKRTTPTLPARCPSCRHVFDDDGPPPRRQCSRKACQHEWVDEDGTRNCPECNNAFSRILEEHVCPECEEPVSEPEKTLFHCATKKEVTATTPSSPKGKFSSSTTVSPSTPATTLLGFLKPIAALAWQQVDEVGRSRAEVFSEIQALMDKLRQLAQDIRRGHLTGSDHKEKQQ